MFQVRRGAIILPLLVAFVLPAPAAAAAPRHAPASTQRSVTAFPMADGALPFGVTAGPHGEYVSLNTAV